MARERAIIGIVAAARQGKSTISRILAEQAMNNGAKGRIKIIDPSGNLGGNLPDDVYEWADKIVSDNLEDIKAKRPVRTSLIIWDDCDVYLPREPKAGSALRYLFCAFAHCDVDIIWNARRLAAVSPLLINSTKWLYLGRIPTADVSGRDRTGLLLSEADIPRIPFHFVQVEGSGLEKYRLRTFKRPDGSHGLEYIR